MDLTLPRGVLPDDLSCLALLHAEGALLLIADIPGCSLHLFRIVLSFFQILLQFDVAVAVRRVLADQILVFVLNDEANAADRLAGNAVDLLDAHRGQLDIFKFYGGQFASLYDNILRSGIQTIAVRGLDLGYDIDAVLQTGNVDQTGRIGGILTDALAVYLLNLEFRACECFAGTLNHLANLQTIRLFVGKGQLIGLTGLDLNGLRGVLQDIAGRRCNLGYDQSAIRQAVQRNRAVYIGFCFLNQFAIRLGDLKFRIFQRLTGFFINLLDDQTRLLSILESYFISLTLTELYRLRSFIDYISIRGLYLSDDICASVQLCEVDNAIRVSNSRFTDNRTITTGDLEGCTGQRLMSLGINLLNQQTGLLAVLNSKSVGLTLFQRYRVRGLVDDVAAGCGNLGRDIICGIQSLYKCRTVLAGCNVLADHIAVCAGQLKDRTGQRLLGFCINLGDGQSRFFGVLNSERSVLVGGMLDLVRLVVQNVLFQGRNFLNLVSACRCLFDGDLTVFVGGVVTEQGRITPDLKLYACQRLLGLAVHLDDLELLLYGVVHYEINIAVRRMLDGDRFLIQHITCESVILLKGISAAVRIRNRELAVRAGGKVADALPVLEALEYNAL